MKRAIIGTAVAAAGLVFAGPAHANATLKAGYCTHLGETRVMTGRSRQP